MLVVREITDVRHHYDVVEVESVEEAEELFAKLEWSGRFVRYVDESLSDDTGGSEVSYLGPVSGSMLVCDEANIQPTLTADEIEYFLGEGR